MEINFREIKLSINGKVLKVEKVNSGNSKAKINFPGASTREVYSIKIYKPPLLMQTLLIYWRNHLSLYKFRFELIRI